MNKFLVTGASGFIGKQVCETLSVLKYSVCGAVRNKDIISKLPNVKYVSIGDISLNQDWKNLLAGYDCVIHCAGLAEQKKKITIDKYNKINAEATIKLAEQCAINGIKKFIFLSSISVLGDATDYNKPFTYLHKANPQNNYAQSKLVAEKKLLEINAKTSLEVVIIRPPLVYGPKPSGNLLKLIKILKLKMPLPFSLINNKKSFINIHNLVDLLICCANHPDAKGKVFLACDGEDVSTPEFIKNISKAIGHSSFLVPFPLFLLNFFFFILGRTDEFKKLTSNLQINDNYTRRILNWKPPLKYKEAIKNISVDKYK